jgi:hypothetical protein
MEIPTHQFFILDLETLVTRRQSLYRNHTYSPVAKLLGAITLVVPGLAKLKEWAYAGFTFAWISAFVAHYVAKDGPKAFMLLILLLHLGISPASRQGQAKVTTV